MNEPALFHLRVRGRLDLLRDVIYGWGLPIALAIVLFGYFVFATSKSQLGIQHPSWLAWGLVIISVALGPLLLRKRIRISSIDVAVFVYLAIVALSFATKGLGSTRIFLYNFAFFMVVSYLAGRLLQQEGLNRFLVASFSIGLLSIFIVLLELLAAPTTMLRNDRILLYTDLYPLSGDATTISSGIVFGMLLVLLVAYRHRIPGWGAPESRYAALAVAALGVAGTCLLILLGSRSGILCTAVIATALLVLSWWSPMSLKVKTLVGAMIAVAIAFQLVSASRMALFGQVSLTEIASVVSKKTPEVVPQLPLRYRQNCETVGNSVLTRIGYYRDVPRLFRSAPVLGIGASNFGYFYCGEKKEGFATPHSTYLHVLVETGIIGISAFTLFIVLLVIRGWKLLRGADDDVRNRVWLIGSLWALMFGLAQLSGNVLTDYHFFAVTGLMAAAVTAASPARNDAVLSVLSEAR
jgi:O-antigen ligase